ncbi:Zinc-binding dehydrogenase, partial [Rhizoctonia solani]
MSAIPTTAQAWRFPPDQKSWNGHKSLELRQVKITAPKQGEVLVKLHAAALNYRYFARNGQLASFLIELTLAGKGQYPGSLSTGPDGQGLIPSCDGAGEVVAVGEGVTQWKKGDRVHSLFFET